AAPPRLKGIAMINVDDIPGAIKELERTRARGLVVYLSPADNVSKCRPIRLRRVHQSLISPQNVLSGPLPALCACLEACLFHAASRSFSLPALASAYGCGHGGTRKSSTSRSVHT